jgi:hypothetical protein
MEYNKILKQKVEFITNIFPSGDSFSTKDVISWALTAEKRGHNEIFFEKVESQPDYYVRVVSYKIG